MTAPVTIEPQPGGSGVVVTVTGEIDYSNVDALEDALSEGQTGDGAVRVERRRVELSD